MPPMQSYSAFLDRKAQLGDLAGFAPARLPDFLFDFQRHLVEWALRMGVGSEVYSAVRQGRRGVGVELKPSYFRQAVKNVSAALSGDEPVAESLFAESESA